MRDRLIELIVNADTYDEYACKLCNKGDDACDCCYAEKLADHLLANGVIVLPCKVDDTIYRCGDPIKKVYEWQIEHIEIYGDEVVFVDDSDNTFTEDDIGKSVFLTREEAERALRKSD